MMLQTHSIEYEYKNNPRATPARCAMGGFGLLGRECLRLRIKRDHDPFTVSEPIAMSPGTLPPAETGIEQRVQYEGDGRIPDDLLGGS